MTYRPLPNFLTIKKSDIDGLGVFAAYQINAGTYLGEARYEINSLLVRTPLGGFINHSDSPNCSYIVDSDNYFSIGSYRVYKLYTTKFIEIDSELTVNYSLPEYDQAKHGWKQNK